MVFFSFPLIYQRRVLIELNPVKLSAPLNLVSQFSLVVEERGSY
jgi:hypothetical protein